MATLRKRDPLMTYMGRDVQTKVYREGIKQTIRHKISLLMISYRPVVYDIQFQLIAAIFMHGLYSVLPISDIHTRWFMMLYDVW